MGIEISSDDIKVGGKSIGSTYQLIIAGAPVKHWVYYDKLYYPLKHIEIVAFPQLGKALRLLTDADCLAEFQHVIWHETGEPYVRSDELDKWIARQ